MPYPNIEQPEFIDISPSLRLRRYHGDWHLAVAGYRDPYVYQNSEGIFDENKIPDENYVKGMLSYLDGAGELYFIEIRDGENFSAIGDVTVKDVNPPIAIWYGKYRGIGIGFSVMNAVIKRLKELGFAKITGSTVYKWNEHSLRLHKKLGYEVVGESEDEYILELTLR
ncbi:MAG: GNAT family N-acetyltransferase [Clostridia bacterium]|nr:GNAT family N-acetyltransferase [Clostridia bacterium]